jgi:hypothetical protein
MAWRGGHAVEEGWQKKVEAFAARIPIQDQ